MVNSPPGKRFFSPVPLHRKGTGTSVREDLAWVPICEAELTSLLCLHHCFVGLTSLLCRPFYCNSNYFWRISNVAEVALFICSGENQGGELFKVVVTPFFFPIYFSEKTHMRVLSGKGTPGQKGQTRGPPSARETDVRYEVKDVVSCFLLTCGD